MASRRKTRMELITGRFDHLTDNGIRACRLLCDEPLWRTCVEMRHQRTLAYCPKPDVSRWGDQGFACDPGWAWSELQRPESAVLNKMTSSRHSAPENLQSANSLKDALRIRAPMF